MQIRTMFVAGLGLLLASGVSWSQEQLSRAPRGAEPILSPEGYVTKIVTLRHYPVLEMEDIIRAIAGEEEVKIRADASTSRLIMQAPAERLKEILLLIQQLDVAGAGTVQGQYLTYRVYMLEIPSKGRDFQPFSLVLESSSQVPSAELLDALKDKELQIGSLFQRDERNEDEKRELVILGRVASREAIKRVVEKIPGSRVRQLVWDDETFTAEIPAAQITRLPPQLQEHLRKFLGDEIQTVGYWFGSLSFPGEIKAPIGPWMLELKARSDYRTNQARDLLLEIEVNRESRVLFMPSTRILSNSVQGRIGKPIIIGYNRDSYGTRTMGAMVILPESDAAQSDAAGKNAP